MSNSTLNYRSFDQLLSDASVDLPTIHKEGFIKTAQLIKVATRVNYDLGLKINQQKDAILEVDRRKAKLPDDFYLFNYGLICLKYFVEQPVITGTQTEEVLLQPNPINADPCNCNPKPCLSRCGDHVYLKQTFKNETRVYEQYAQFRIKPGKEVASGCPNLSFHSGLEAYIKNGCLQTNFENGTLYINYLGNMEDEGGNLLVPDHPLLNEYYEYAIKQRILENMFLEGEPTSDKLQLIEQRIRTARNNALSIVNTPDFKDFKETWEMNRKAMLRRYYEIFI